MTDPATGDTNPDTTTDHGGSAKTTKTNTGRRAHFAAPCLNMIDPKGPLKAALQSQPNGLEDTCDKLAKDLNLLQVRIQDVQMAITDLNKPDFKPQSFSVEDHSLGIMKELEDADSTKNLQALFADAQTTYQESTKMIATLAKEDQLKKLREMLRTRLLDGMVEIAKKFIIRFNIHKGKTFSAENEETARWSIAYALNDDVELTESLAMYVGKMHSETAPDIRSFLVAFLENKTKSLIKVKQAHQAAAQEVDLCKMFEDKYPEEPEDENPYGIDAGGVKASMSTEWTTNDPSKLFDIEIKKPDSSLETVIQATKEHITNNIGAFTFVYEKNRRINLNLRAAEAYEKAQEKAKATRSTTELTAEALDTIQADGPASKPLESIVKRFVKSELTKLGYQKRNKWRQRNKNKNKSSASPKEQGEDKDQASAPQSGNNNKNKSESVKPKTGKNGSGNDNSQSKKTKKNDSKKKKKKKNGNNKTKNKKGTKHGDGNNSNQPKSKKQRTK